jgi:hypothetical protein
MVWNAATPAPDASSRTWDDELRALKAELQVAFTALMDAYPTRLTAQPGVWRVGYAGLKAALPGWATGGQVWYVAETDGLYVQLGAATTAWTLLYPTGAGAGGVGGNPGDALRLKPGYARLADAFMYRPGDVILDDLPRTDYAPLPGYRALIAGRIWLGDLLYTARACFSFDLSTAPTGDVGQVFFDLDIMEAPGGAVSGWLDILPGTSPPTPLEFHHALDPALASVGDDKVRLANPPFTGTPTSLGWDITPYYRTAVAQGGMILRLRVADEVTVPPKGAIWGYGIASADVAGREPRFTFVYGTVVAPAPPPIVPVPAPIPPPEPEPTPPPYVPVLVAYRLQPGRGYAADAHMYAPGDVIADHIERPGYLALAVGRLWVGETLYTARACFTFDLTTQPASGFRQVFFDFDAMEVGENAGGGLLDVLRGGPGPTPLAFHHALDPPLFTLGDSRFRLVNPPFTGPPASAGWDITPEYLEARPHGGIILRTRRADESTVPPKTQVWAYGIASAEVPGREPRLTFVY